MMCDNCMKLADLAKKSNGAYQRDHLSKKNPQRCQYPTTCTCQHRPVGEYVRKED